MTIGSSKNSRKNYIRVTLKTEDFSSLLVLKIYLEFFDDTYLLTWFQIPNANRLLRSLPEP